MDNAVMPVPHFTLAEMSTRPPLARALRSAFEAALAGRGPMDVRVGGVEGFCGQKHRLFFKNLVRCVESPRYLEVGIFRGATLCAAIAGNKVKAAGIDNWTSTAGKQTNFMSTLRP